MEWEIEFYKDEKETALRRMEDYLKRRREND